MMRAPTLRIHADDLVIDSFAGGGGASLGIEWALGRSPDIAINHDAEAIAMHAANHPETRHYTASVWDVDPAKACAGRRVALAWFSPDCKHFSKAKGGKPVEKKIRGLAWVVIRWAKAVKPRVIILENVEEFQDWGPLLEDSRPCPARRGLTFRRWIRQLERAGYEVETRELRACDYGAPTIRKRLFVIARCDGLPITWPEATHGQGRSEPWRVAAECIEWALPCPSIFERKRPLAENTLRRIARGIWRYVIDCPKPFIVSNMNHNVPRDVDQPVSTILSGNHKYLVEPFIAPVAHAGDERSHPVTEPMRTITGAHRGEHALIEPFLVRTAHGEEDASGKRRGRGEHSLEEPLPTQLGSNDFALVSPFMVGAGGPTYSGEPRGLGSPQGTVLAENNRALVSAFLARHYGGHENNGATPSAPIPTITAKDHHALVASSLVKLKGTAKDGQPVTEPLHTVQAGGLHYGEVRAFLIAYYGTQQRPQLDLPLPTATTKDRFGLVTVDGQDYAIADIGMRMLVPRELFRAQGFPDSYVIDPAMKGKPLSKTAQVRMCGNSVCPPLVEALVRAQFERAEAVA